MRDETIIRFAIKKCRDRADRMVAARRREDFEIAKSMEQALEWALGADNAFGVMMEAIKACESETIQ